MISAPRLTLDEAKILIEGGELKAKELGISVNIAIVDDEGYLIAFHRMDDARIIGIETAINKAFTSALSRRPTRVYSESAQPGKPSYGIQNMFNGRFTILKGGLPIEVDGKVIGGIGVGGAYSSDQDEEIARAALNYLKSKTGLNVNTNV
ncbi:heme-binding protein [Sulfolobus sp. E5-1-F]|uniref:GlcG/HbpS family heme-binding protein n=1 Tax=Saccharolobus sp. E5-1-F TaxID=2663019 RepID=UPI00129509D2|nr:heme-binding protein [Sulfolobus sp. E5-1-F]QGA54011.1 heme-binding protein [Sulfolobus sp. E5-1-F]